jgi:NAD(P)H dehydrogenase (quinone)
MNRKKTLVILGHPNKKSFCAALHKEYVDSAKKSGKDVKILNIIDMKFNPVKQQEKTEKDIVKAQKLITWAEHIVFVFPIWWGNMPALLKGFFDRTFSSGFAFRFKKNKRWDKLLKGRTAHIITTMDTPIPIYKLMFGNPLRKNLRGILWFCGVSPIKYTFLSPITKVNMQRRKAYLLRVRKLAQR